MHVAKNDPFDPTTKLIHHLSHLCGPRGATPKIYPPRLRKCRVRLASCKTHAYLVVPYRSRIVFASYLYFDGNLICNLFLSSSSFYSNGMYSCLRSNYFQAVV